MKFYNLFFYSLVLFFLASCKKDKPEENQELADFELNWTKCLGTEYADDYAGSVIDGAGNIYIYGVSQPDGFNANLYVSKVALSNQIVQWTKTYDLGDQDNLPSPSQNGHANGGGGANGIDIDAAGNIFICGQSKQGFFESFVLKLDGSGNTLWEVHWEANLGGLANGEAKAYALDEKNGLVFVTGSSAAGIASNGSAMPFLLVLNGNDGTVQSSTKVGFDPSPTYNDIGYVVKSPNGADVYVAGWEGDDNSAIIYKFSDAGATFNWYERVDLGVAGRFTDMTFDGSGNIYLAADYRGVQTYIGVTKLSPDGNHLWTKKMAGEGNDRNNVSTVRIIDGKLYVGGRGSFEHYDVGQFGDGTWIEMDYSGNVLRAYNYYTKDFTSGERIEGIHLYAGNLIMVGETWPEETGINGRWYIPNVNASAATPNIVKHTSIDLFEGDGYINSNTFTVSSLSLITYDPEEGTKGSADIMIHSIPK